jgi:hypothetical protein
MPTEQKASKWSISKEKELLIDSINVGTSLFSVSPRMTLREDGSISKEINKYKSIREHSCNYVL